MPPVPQTGFFAPRFVRFLGVVFRHPPSGAKRVEHATVAWQQNSAMPLGRGTGRCVQYQFLSLWRGQHAFHSPTTSRWDGRMPGEGCLPPRRIRAGSCTARIPVVDFLIKKFSRPKQNSHRRKFSSAENNLHPKKGNHSAVKLFSTF